MRAEGLNTRGPDPGAPATELAGWTFAGLFRAIKVVRPDRPIHPHGVSLDGELIRHGGGRDVSGLDWLDSPGVEPVKARFSRSVGLPPSFPDILGLALRINPSGEAADVLFASTGWRFPARFALIPRRSVSGAAFTTLMPYQGRYGPVLLGLRTRQLPDGSAGDWVLELHFAKPAGQWVRAGELRLRESPVATDTPLRFNPVEHPLPDAGTYPWTRRLRERSYRAAQQPSPRSPRNSSYTGESSAPTERKPMATVNKVFNSPAEEVWKVIADGWLYSGWVVGASRIRAVDAQWPDEGSRLHHSVGAWPLVINDSTSVASVDPGRSLELVARVWPAGEARVLITIEDQGMQCRVTMAEDAVRGPGRFVPKPLRDALIRARNRETLNRLELMAAGGAGS
ncbi:SRPBCC family protein [Arthrobacter sp. D1-29]